MDGKSRKKKNTQGGGGVGRRDPKRKRGPRSGVSLEARWREKVLRRERGKKEKIAEGRLRKGLTSFSGGVPR